VVWLIRWLLYPITIAYDLWKDSDTYSLMLDIVAMVFGAILFAATVTFMILGDSRAVISPWWLMPAGLGSTYLFFGLIHHWTHQDLYGNTPY
jgi:ABC-type phosphate/phosphonate transport system permease subunit